MLKQASFEFRTLFCPFSFSKDEMGEHMARAGFVAGKKKGWFHSGASVRVELSAWARAGDPVSQARLGAAAFLNNARIPKKGASLLQRVVQRIQDTRWIIGCTAVEGKEFTSQGASAIAALQRNTASLAYDGWTFVAPDGPVVVDVKNRKAHPTKPVIFAAAYRADEAPKTLAVRDCEVVGPLESPSDFRLAAPALERQLEFLSVKHASKDARKAADEIKGELDGTVRWMIVLPSVDASVTAADVCGSRLPPSVVLDGFAFFRPDGSLWLDRTV